MNKKIIKVIAIIAAYFISMIGAAFAGSVMALVAEEAKEKEKAKTETKTEVNKERSDENISYGFSRENLEELRKLGEKYKD
jgi:uncharacterized protein involved in cysteine biosynthesis